VWKPESRPPPTLFWWASISLHDHFPLEFAPSIVEAAVPVIGECMRPRQVDGRVPGIGYATSGISVITERLQR
jgi:hypothetical protein